MRFEITCLDADGDHVTHTADAAEVEALLAWAGRHGVKVRVRLHQPAAEPQEDTENGHAGRHSLSDDTQGAKDPAPAEGERDIESWKERGVALRAFFYIFGTHLFAGCVWLLFYLGQPANK